METVGKKLTEVKSSVLNVYNGHYSAENFLGKIYTHDIEDQICQYKATCFFNGYYDFLYIDKNSSDVIPSYEIGKDEANNDILIIYG